MAGRLTPGDRARIAELYDGRLREGGEHVRTVGWASRADQTLRFETLFRDLDPADCRVLDVGSGLGDLVPYLDAVTGGRFRYTGIDVAPGLVERAAVRHSGPNVEFHVGELADVADSEFDLVVCSGALTFETGDNDARALETLSEMFKMARRAVAANFLSSYVDFQEDRNHHYDPVALFRFGKQLTPWVALYHDYPLWEFTIQLRRQPWRTYKEDGGEQ